MVISKFSYKTNVLHHSDSCLSNNKLLTTYLNFNNNPLALNYFLLSLEVRASVVVLYLCFILALKWKPSKKLIMYAYSRMFYDDKRSFHHCTMIHVVTLGNSTILICHCFVLIELRAHLHLLCRGNLT